MRLPQSPRQDDLDETITPHSGTGMPRRDVLRLLTGAAGYAALGVTFGFSAPTEAAEKVRVISGARITEMPDHNMPDGFSRAKIIANIDGQPNLMGSVFFLEDSSKAKADFITEARHPELFDAQGMPKFNEMQARRSRAGQSTTALVAAAYLAPGGANQIEGTALENGVMIGDDHPLARLNGILVIKDGVPSIEYYNQIPDFDKFLEEAQRNNWHVFQQTSYIRPPDGVFESSNSNTYELRFFVEGEGKKAMINFTEPMTYTEALKVLQNLAGFQIEKAIGLDMGPLSEGYFFDRDGQGYLMKDERYGRGRYTNVLELYSGE